VPEPEETPAPQETAYQPDAREEAHYDDQEDAPVEEQDDEQDAPAHDQDPQRTN
jgi:hypothetical protein